MSKFLKRVLQFFLQGLIVIAPIGVTIYAILWLFNTVDNILPSIIDAMFPGFFSNAYGGIKRVPGLGFVFAIFLVVLIGWISSSFFVSRLVDIFDKVLENTPGVRFIYTSVKDFLEAFAGNKKKFDQPVLVNVDGADVWRIGFITHSDALHFDLQEHVVVYVPHSYAISGITYIVPREKIKSLKNITPAEAMKFTLSGGITQVD